jgi:outer membrane murein-binding lipoprotein Lpp
MLNAHKDQLAYTGYVFQTFPNNVQMLNAQKDKLAETGNAKSMAINVLRFSAQQINYAISEEDALQKLAINVHLLNANQDKLAKKGNAFKKKPNNKPTNVQMECARKERFAERVSALQIKESVEITFVKKD